MGEVSTIGLDLAKSVFQAHGADASGAVIFRKKLRREQVLAFFARQPRCLVAMEACGGGGFWAREIARLGHRTRLIPPSYVKPFVKRQKNDAADAEAICEAVQRPTMRFVRPKSAEAQGAATVFRARDLLVRQRTQIINALRGHLAEFGLVVHRGRHSAGGAGPRSRDVQARPRLRRLGRAHAAAALQRRKGTARANVEDGRTHLAPAPDRRRELRRKGGIRQRISR